MPGNKTKCKNCSGSYVDLPGHVQRRHPDIIQDEDMDGGNNSRRRQKLVYADFVNKTPGDRVLTCGKGGQLGHPGRTTSTMPRAIGTLPDNTKILQVVAGRVHTTILTDEHEVYSCGFNDDGTVPVKDLAADGFADELTVIEFTEEIKKEGIIVQLTSGAGFIAALTHRGSVIAWGNLRDENGAFEPHHLFAKMKKGPTVIIHHKYVQIVKIAAGEHHLVMLSSKGEIYTFGVGSHGQLGNSRRTKKIRTTYMADVTGKSLHRSVLEKSKLIKFSNIFAGGYWTMAQAMDGRIFACGLNKSGQLGFEGSNFIIDLLTHSPAFPSDKKWTHIAGVDHIVARTDEGEVYRLGLNTMIKDRYAYGFGYDSVGQLGLGNTYDENKCITFQKRITSAHLNGYKIISVTLADKHSVFLAAKINE
uniref:Regulator of chromosome condensation n=1 Tax=Panagrolaimus davidi TaxID=227884 RepID=A0A914PF24_9BILA